MTGKKILLGLSSLIVLFLGIHLLLIYAVNDVGIQQLQFFANIFNLDNESSIPTWFSQLLLFMSAVVAVCIARKQKKGSWQWWVVALVFVFLSVDEVALIHEQLIDVVRRSGAGETVGLSSWYIYAGILVGIMAIALLRFWWRLPGKTRWLLLASASIYLVGAVVMDVVGGGYVDQGFLHEGLIVGVEEGLEMFGAALFLYTLLDYSQRQHVEISLKLKSPH